MIVALPFWGVLRFNEWQTDHQYEETDGLVAAEVIETPAATVDPTSEPTVTSPPSPTALPTPTASPSPIQKVVAFAPTHILVPKTKGVKSGINALVIPKPTVKVKSRWTGKTVSSFGVPDDGDKNPATGKLVDPRKIVAWWSSGPKIGDTSSVDGVLVYPVLLGHTWSSGSAVFNEIGKLQAGDPVTLSAGTSATAKLVVSKVIAQIDKSDTSALQRVLQSAPPGTAAAMVTCSGQLQNVLDGGRSHEDNTVVFLTWSP